MKKQGLQDEETGFHDEETRLTGCRNKVCRMQKQGLQDEEKRFTG